MLPRLATFFDITIDELFYGIKPKMNDIHSVNDAVEIDNSLIPDDGKLRIVQFLGKRLLCRNTWREGELISLNLADIEVERRLDINVWGSLSVAGNINGNAESGGSMSCGNIGGHAESGGSMSCKGIGGSAEAGGSITYEGNIDGPIEAGGSVKCGNVSGGIESGSSVTANDITGGDIDCGGSLSCCNLKANKVSCNTLSATTVDCGKIDAKIVVRR